VSQVKALRRHGYVRGKARARFAISGIDFRLG